MRFRIQDSRSSRHPASPQPTGCFILSLSSAKCRQIDSCTCEVELGWNSSVENKQKKLKQPGQIVVINVCSRGPYCEGTVHPIYHICQSWQRSEVRKGKWRTRGRLKRGSLVVVDVSQAKEPHDVEAESLRLLRQPCGLVLPIQHALVARQRVVNALRRLNQSPAAQTETCFKNMNEECAPP